MGKMRSTQDWKLEGTLTANEGSNSSPWPLWLIEKLGRSFSGHYGFQIGRLVVTIGCQCQPPWRRRCDQIDHCNIHSNRQYLLFFYFPRADGGFLGQETALVSQPIINIYHEPVCKRSDKPSYGSHKTTKTIKRNMICNQIGNRTIEVAGTIKRRFKGFSPLPKTLIFY